MGCGIKHILTLSDAIVFNDINVIDNLNRDITNECKFSWSSDRVCWTSWVDYASYSNICSNISSDFYLRILISGVFGDLYVGNSLTNCFDICIDSSDTFLKNFCEEENLFNPYSNLDCALELYEQTSNSIICMFGIPAFYFRVVPQKDTADYTFKEYVLHNVESVKQIKIMVPDGSMPSSNPKFSELDFEWEAPWEVEIGKQQFARAFGDTAFPKYQDFIYVPLMKRMWDVNAAYEEKNEGFMWRSTTWKLQLTKYNESTNVITDNFDDIIDAWVINNYEDAFGKKERLEQEREVGATPLSAPTFAATNLCDIFMEDAIRKQYTKNDISIINKQYNHKSNILARNYYKFKNENACVTYQKGYCGDCGTLMFVLETQGTLGGNLEKEIIQFGPIVIDMKYDEEKQKFYLIFGDLKQELNTFSTYMVVCKWNRDTFSTEMIIYSYRHDENIPVYKLRPEMYYFDVEKPLCELVGHYNNDFITKQPEPCQVHAYPLFITNIKLYNKSLDIIESLKEMVKYTTTHENCVINDLARPISSGHGYDVK